MIGWLTFQVVGGSYRAKSYSSCVFLFLRLVIIDLLGELSGTYDEETSCERIQRASMTYLFNTNKVAYLPYHVEGCPIDWLVHQDHLAFFESVFRVQESSFLNCQWLLSNVLLVFVLEFIF